jgi:hypothetical protein
MECTLEGRRGERVAGTGSRVGAASVSVCETVNTALSRNVSTHSRVSCLRSLRLLGSTVTAGSCLRNVFHVRVDIAQGAR